MHEIEKVFADFLVERRKQGLYRELTRVRRPDARTLEQSGKTYINFASNDSLGLSFHPEVVARAQEWAGRYGAGAGASRLVTGNLELFAQIEDKIAAFKGFEAALVMASGFQANASVLPALFDRDVLGAEPIVFADRLNHASMHIGSAAAGITQSRFKHNDIPHLESLCQRAHFKQVPKFILTESVFSMDGDLAPLDQLRETADMFGSFLMVDEAHATGILGPKGKGLADKADLVVGTFSKAMGSFGAYIACSNVVKEYLVNKCAGLIYATALPPSVLGAIDAALDLVPDMDGERARVARLAETFRAEVKALGYRTGLSRTHIVPVMTDAAEKALALCERLKDNGLWSVAIRPPTVPPNTARVRFAFTAAHTEGDIERLVTVLREHARKENA
ncbi:MAG: 8-amino-7-oxononanoate synthase [Alphaproteobacteria bacterium]|nr:8-amino-7-oxononanoate synthase [Alphaproteobacteria bacterium]